MNKHLTLIPTTPPIALSWEEDAQTKDTVMKPIFDNPALATADRMVCAHCGEDVTRGSLRIAVAGSHRHAVPTSHGIDQEIGCFSLAPGCLSAGHFALDFGHEEDGFWQMAFCATCGDHLGWHHQSSDGLGFYGLILDHLAPAADIQEDAA
jgi:hypothetical protein